MVTKSHNDPVRMYGKVYRNSSNNPTLSIWMDSGEVDQDWFEKIPQILHSINLFLVFLSLLVEIVEETWGKSGDNV